MPWLARSITKELPTAAAECMHDTCWLTPGETAGNTASTLWCMRMATQRPEGSAAAMGGTSAIVLFLMGNWRMLNMCRLVGTGQCFLTSHASTLTWPCS